MAARAIVHHSQFGLLAKAVVAADYWADYWTPEQALAVFELFDDLRQVVADQYLPQIQARLREQRHTNPDFYGETYAPCSGDAF